MDEDIAGLLGLDLNDPETAAMNAAVERDIGVVEKLVQVRRDLGLSQAEVARRMGRRQPNVSAFERIGGDPHLSTIRRYAQAVGARVIHHVVIDGEARNSTRVAVSPRVVRPGPRSFYRKAR